MLSRKHGQQIMGAIFGKNQQPELFNLRVGLLSASVVGRSLDSASLPVVPKLLPLLYIRLLILRLFLGPENAKFQKVFSSYEAKGIARTEALKALRRDYSNSRVLV